MPDDGAPLQQAVLHHAGPRLPHHLPDGGRCYLRVVRRPGVALRELRRQVLEVGEVDVHLALQSPQGLHPVIAPGVPHHRHRERLFQQPGDHMGVVGGVDEVDVVCALADELQADLPQPLHRYRFSEVLVADAVVLAEDTVQTAPGEKDGAGAIGAGDGRLLPHVEGGPGQHRRFRHPAAALPHRSRALRPALPGTQIADHS